MNTDHDAEILPSLMSTRISRRRALQVAAAAGVAAFLGGTSAGRVAAQDATPVTGSFKMATWLGYMDWDDSGASASLDRFAAETGVTNDYQEAVNGNEEFFAAQLQGPLSNGLSTGWDLVVLTDEMSQKLVSYGWLEPIDAAATPNYQANLLEIYRGRDWDPGNLFAAPYVSGMTGLGYDQNITGPQSNLDIVFAQDFAGRVTYLTEFRDTVGVSALRLKYDPSTITEEQFQASLAEVKTAVDSGVVRTLPGQGYVNDMINGDVVLAIAWSGDVAGSLILEQSEEQDFQWTLAEQGGMLWTDNMSIPKGAENKAQAQVWIDWYYDPRNAAQIAAAIKYLCPVKGASEAIVAFDPSLATNTLIFPDEAMIARLYQFRSLDLDTAARWTAEFDSVIGH
jgi:spermidine/putrescine transport system substrate-binding protein